MRTTSKATQSALLACVVLSLLLPTMLGATERDAEAEAAYQERVQAIMRDAFLSKALNRSTEGLVSKRMPDGSVALPLQGRFQHAMLARISENGEIEYQCDHDIESAAKFLAGGRIVSGHEHEISRDE